MELEALKVALLSNTISRVINKYILCEYAVCFGGKIDLILELKENLSKYFDIPVKNIEIVGSAKLGISLSDMRYGQKYNDASDIDLVLVSSELFDRAWHELLRLENQYHKLDTKDRSFLEESYDTVHRGFISPDRLPIKTPFYRYWWEIFSKLSNKKEYEYRKIRGRLFKDWWFVEKYYSINLKKSLKTEE